MRFLGKRKRPFNVNKTRSRCQETSNDQETGNSVVIGGEFSLTRSIQDAIARAAGQDLHSSFALSTSFSSHHHYLYVTEDNLNFVIVPLFHPRFRRMPGSKQVRTGPGTYSDQCLDPDTWQGHVVGKSSRWIDLSNKNNLIRDNSISVLRYAYCELG